MDIVLDTNAFRIFIEDSSEKFIEAVVERCDTIYVPKNIWKELRSAFPHVMFYPLRELGKRGKCHARKVERIEKLPKKIEEELGKCGADPFDMTLVELAFKRREVVERVYVVSNDYCLQGVGVFLERHGIHIRSLKEFKEEYLQQEQNGKKVK
jgi:rRNA maturation endonuclease Nob1